MNYDKPTYLRRPLGIRKPPVHDGVIHRSAAVKCKYCGNEQLQWRETSSGFRLFELNGERHFCAGMQQQAEYRQQKQTTSMTPQSVVAAIMNETKSHLDNVDEGREWTKEEVISMLERASLNALINPGGV